MGSASEAGRGERRREAMRSALARLDPRRRGAPDDERGQIEAILATARELMEMEVAYFSEFTPGRQVVRGAEGEPLVEEGMSVPLAESYCARMVAGELPNKVPDAAADPRVSDLPATGEIPIGAYVGIPLRFSDGRLLGSLCCVSRAPDPELAERDVGFMHVLARLLADQIEREELQAEKGRLEVEAASVRALLAALEARDRYSGNHSLEVVELSRAVARELGHTEEEVTRIGLIAMLHDIGKVAVPDAVLRKPGPLDDAEWELMRQHPVTGAGIVASLPGLAHLAPAVRATHERWDGRGYPDGLAGEEIPEASRIVLVCDAYDAITSDRPYRPRMTPEEAFEELRHQAGTQFCPRCVDAFVRAVAPIARPRPELRSPAAASE